MKKLFFVSLGIAALAICVSASAAELLAIRADTAVRQVDTLFQQALAADQAGNSALRDRLLAVVLTQEPNHKLARWHSGQVFHNGKWQALDTVERLVASDPRWQEYRSRVEAGEDNLAAHAELARWCRTQGLGLEEQWHWFNVLRHDAGHREALGGLGLRPYRGEYLTPEQIAAYEAEEKQAKHDFKKFADLLQAAMREAERSEGTQRNAALNKISGIQNPAAIQAIVEVVLADVANEKRILSKLGKAQGEKLLRQMQLAAIAALSEMPEHEATLRLLEVALYASDSQIRGDAAHALKYREMTDFVPLLMAGLTAPIELSMAVNTLPNGKITVLADFYETGPQAERKHSTSSDYLTQYIRKETNNIPGTIRSQRLGIPGVTKVTNVWTNHARDVQNASVQILDTQNKVASENAFREEHNSRVNAVLAIVFEKDDGDPQVWWNMWKQYNELYTPEELPRNETSERYDFTTQFVQDVQYGRTMSCFVAGTPVWMQSGPVAIEKVKIGDLVLSQDPHTGELNYRPVVDTTVRPPSGTIKLSFNNEAIITTRGHRFWIAGQGWKMAKFLKPGSQLVAVSGSFDIQTAEAAEEDVAYNLEVDQFHTYFVGSSRVLVHDNTCPQPTINILPGVSPRAADKPAQAPQVALRN